MFKINPNNLIVFCYEGEKSWSRIWSSLEFIVHSKAEEFKLDVNNNASVLQERFHSWWPLWPPWGDNSDTYQKNIVVSPYGKSCIGLSYHGAATPHGSVILKENGKSLECVSITCA